LKNESQEHLRDKGCEVIDYRCEDGRFPVSARSVTISNPNSLSSREAGDNPGIRSWKRLYNLV
jgi:hypothetical protein